MKTNRFCLTLPKGWCVTAAGREASLSFWRWPRGLQAAAFGLAVLLLFGWQLREHLAAADRRLGFVADLKDGHLLVADVSPDPLPASKTTIARRVVFAGGKKPLSWFSARGKSFPFR